jgi:hypothetical protein
MLLFKVILHQFWVKKVFPWKFNMEYGGTFNMVFHVHIYMMERKYNNDGHDWFDLIWFLVLNDTFSNISAIYHGDQF